MKELALRADRSAGEDDRREVEKTELLRLEREHVLALAQSEKTQARLEHLRTTGEILGN